MAATPTMIQARAVLFPQQFYQLSSTSTSILVLHAHMRTTTVINRNSSIDSFAGDISQCWGTWWSYYTLQWLKTTLVMSKHHWWNGGSHTWQIRNSISRYGSCDSVHAYSYQWQRWGHRLREWSAHTSRQDVQVFQQTRDVSIKEISGTISNIQQLW